MHKYLTIFDEFDSMFNFSNIHKNLSKWNLGENNYKLSLDLPGYNKQDITVTQTESKIGNLISIRAENEVRGKYSFSETIPDNADLNEITSKLENGVLEVNIKKTKKEKSKVNLIEVK